MKKIKCLIIATQVVLMGFLPTVYAKPKLQWGRLQAYAPSKTSTETLKKILIDQGKIEEDPSSFNPQLLAQMIRKISKAKQLEACSDYYRKSLQLFERIGNDPQTLYIEFFDNVQACRHYTPNMQTEVDALMESMESCFYAFYNECNFEQTDRGECDFWDMQIDSCSNPYNVEMTYESTRIGNGVVCAPMSNSDIYDSLNAGIDRNRVLQDAAACESAANRIRRGN